MQRLGKILTIVAVVPCLCCEFLRAQHRQAEDGLRHWEDLEHQMLCRLIFAFVQAPSHAIFKQWVLLDAACFKI